MSYIERRLGDGGYPGPALPDDRPAQPRQRQPVSQSETIARAALRAAEPVRNSATVAIKLHPESIRDMERALAGRPSVIMQLKDVISGTAAHVAKRVEIVFMTNAATELATRAADKAAAAMNRGRPPQIVLDGAALSSPEALPRSLSVPRRERLFVRIENGEKLDRETFIAMCEKLLGVGTEGATVFFAFGRSREDLSRREDAIDDLADRRPRQIGSRYVSF